MKYLVVIEPTETGFSAYSPDLPGCVATGATGATEEEVEREMQGAMEFHVEGLTLEGHPVLEPFTRSAYLEVARAA